MADHDPADIKARLARARFWLAFHLAVVAFGLFLAVRYPKAPMFPIMGLVFLGLLSLINSFRNVLMLSSGDIPED